MPEPFDAPTAWYARFAVQRLLGLTYLIAFLSAAHQFVPLLGERGLEPIARHVDRRLMRVRPSLFHLHDSDRFYQGVAWLGVTTEPSDPCVCRRVLRAPRARRRGRARAAGIVRP